MTAQFTLESIREKAMKTTHTPETDWDQWTDVGLVVLIYSGVMGWIEVARWNDTSRPFSEVIREARAKYEAMDGRKMLLNFGNIIAASLHQTDATH